MRATLWFAPLLAVPVLAGWMVTGRADGTDAAFGGLTLDDAWIHLVYARSLAETGVPSYNPPVPEAGFTSPLWMLLLAVGLKLFGTAASTAALVAKGLSFLCALGTATLAGVLCRWAGSARAAPLAIALVALEPSLASAAVSGMEVHLAAALLLGAMAAFAASRHGLAGALCGLGLLARPEFLLLAPILVTTRVLLPVPGKWREAVQLAWPTILAQTMFSGYCLYATGRPLPNTYYVMSGEVHEPLAALSRLLRDGIGETPYFTLGVGTPLCAWGAWRSLRAAPAAIAAMLGFPTLFVIGLALTRSFPAVRPFFWHRYLEPVLPLLLVLLAVGAMGAAEALRRRGTTRLIAATASLGLGALGLIALPPDLLRERVVYSWSARNVHDLHVAPAEWIAAHAPAGRPIAVEPAGAIRFFAKNEVIDLFGLNTHEMIGGGGDAYLTRKNPAWFVIYPEMRGPYQPRFRLYGLRSFSTPRYAITGRPPPELWIYRAESR